MKPKTFKKLITTSLFISTLAACGSDGEAPAAKATPTPAAEETPMATGEATPVPQATSTPLASPTPTPMASPIVSPTPGAIATPEPKNEPTEPVVTSEVIAFTQGAAITIPACIAVPVTVGAKPEQQLIANYDISFVGDTGITVISNSEEVDTEMQTETVLVSAENAQAGKNIRLTASYDDGSTVHTASTDITIAENKACIKNEDGSQRYAFDHHFETLRVDEVLNETEITADKIKIVKQGQASVAIAEGEGLQGSNALQVTINPDASNANWAGAMVQHWGKATNSVNGTSLFAEHYGIGAEAIGKTIKTSVWVKLKLANGSSPETATAIHNITPNDTLESTGFKNNRLKGVIFRAELDVTSTDWQYVEFIDIKRDEDPENDADSFTIPSTWDADKTAVIAEFMMLGLNPGDSYLYDDYSVIEVK